MGLRNSSSALPARSRAASMRTDRMESLRRGAASCTRSCLRKRLQRSHRSGANQRVVVRETGLNGRQGGRAEVSRNQRKRSSARNSGLGRVRDQRCQQSFRFRQPAPAGIESFDEMRFAPAAGSIPLRYRIFCPLCGLVGVTLVTGVGCPIRNRKIRSRHTEAVVSSNIDHHVRSGRHVTVDAKSSGGVRLVMVMLRSAELRRQMALAANGVQIFVKEA